MIHRTLGIDASLNGTGLCLLSTDDHGYTTTEAELTIKPTKGSPKGVERLRFLFSALNRWLDEHHIVGSNISVALIEEYAYGASGKIASIGEWGGIIRLILSDRGIRIAEMNVAHLKQFVTGMGNSKKEQMLLGVYQRFHRSYVSNDAADAFALATAAQAWSLPSAVAETGWRKWFRRALSAEEKKAASKIQLTWEQSEPKAIRARVKR